MLLFSSECISKMMRCVLEDASTERTKTSLSFKHFYGRKTEPRGSTRLCPCQGQNICSKGKEIKVTGGKGNIKYQVLLTICCQILEYGDEKFDFDHR